jgi:hypothetical protein
MNKQTQAVLTLFAEPPHLPVGCLIGVVLVGVPHHLPSLEVAPVGVEGGDLLCARQQTLSNR